MCYKKHVKQFHTEGETTVNEYSLGTYDEAAINLDDVKVKLSLLASLIDLQHIEISNVRENINMFGSSLHDPERLRPLD